MEDVDKVEGLNNNYCVTLAIHSHSLVLMLLTLFDTSVIFPRTLVLYLSRSMK
jgi:hypothetical protein